MYETNDWSIFVKLCGVTFGGKLEGMNYAVKTAS